MLSGRARVPRALRGRGGRRGKFARSSSQPLCSLTAAAHPLRGGLVGERFLRQNEVTFPASGRFGLRPNAAPPFRLPQQSVSLLCLNLPFVLGEGAGLPACPRAAWGWVVRQVFFGKRSVSLSLQGTPRSLRKPFAKSPDFLSPLHLPRMIPLHSSGRKSV